MKYGKTLQYDFNVDINATKIYKKTILLQHFLFSCMLIYMHTNSDKLKSEWKKIKMTTNKCAKC